MLLQERICQLEDMLDNIEDRSNSLVKQPSTRVQACQLLSTTKELTKEVNEFQLPDLEAEYSDEDGERLDNALDRYNNLRTSLAEKVARAETLCVCWDNLDADMTELTNALTNGGAGKITMDKLESSIAALKDMFTERRTIIEVGWTNMQTF